MSDALDITREVCPMTYVRVKLALERLADGAELVVRLKGSEPKKNVPASAIDDGHEVLSMTEDAEGVATLRLRVHHEERR